MKKLLTLFISLICVLGLAACDSKSDIDYGETETLTTKSTEDGIQPGGIQLEEVFDITVSYANWSDMSDIYAKSINGDKLSISSVLHLPIYKFDTLAELKQFKNDVKDDLTIDRGYDEMPSFNDSTAKYDDVFFKENTLLLVYVEASSGSYRFGVESIHCADDEFVIHVKYTNRPEGGTCDMAGWFITVAVPNSMIADCTEFDADLYW